MITSAQCRAARGLVGLSQQELADSAKVGLSTLRNFETGRTMPVAYNLAAITTSLEAAGVEFIPENGGGPGVRLNKSGAADHPKPIGPATDAFAAMEDAVAQDRGKAPRGRGERVASIKETGEELPQVEWERLERADKKPKA